MIRRSNQIEAEVIRLIVTTREKFPHSVAWNNALKKVIWRYTTPDRDGQAHTDPLDSAPSGTDTGEE